MTTLYIYEYDWITTDDDNRIILNADSAHPDCKSDYINASYIDVSPTP